MRLRNHRKLMVTSCSEGWNVAVGVYTGDAVELMNPCETVREDSWRDIWASSWTEIAAESGRSHW